MTTIYKLYNLHWILWDHMTKDYAGNLPSTAESTEELITTDKLNATKLNILNRCTMCLTNEIRHKHRKVKTPYLWSISPMTSVCPFLEWSINCKIILHIKQQQDTQTHTKRRKLKQLWILPRRRETKSATLRTWRREITFTNIFFHYLGMKLLKLLKTK